MANFIIDVFWTHRCAHFVPRRSFSVFCSGSGRGWEQYDAYSDACSAFERGSWSGEHVELRDAHGALLRRARRSAVDVRGAKVAAGCSARVRDLAARLIRYSTNAASWRDPERRNVATRIANSLLRRWLEEELRGQATQCRYGGPRGAHDAVSEYWGPGWHVGVFGRTPKEAIWRNGWVFLPSDERGN